jgi:hypothetical protein
MMAERRRTVITILVFPMRHCEMSIPVASYDFQLGIVAISMQSLSW